jgi:glyoxylase-like metal-dependent hydrolase (beta-lactamase superfamily II)
MTFGIEMMMNQRTICTACGTTFPEESTLPDVCPICEDDRQYVPNGVQTWASATDLARDHLVEIRELNQSLYELKLSPEFAIGQRAFLVAAPDGNILWDCIPLLDEAAIEFVRSKGGIRAIALSHPHFYSNMNDWANEFDCPIYIHEADEQWIFNNSERVELWSGSEKTFWDGVKIHNIGGHFAGSSILHIPFLSPEGTILCGDTFVVSPSKTHLAVMHSYPNKIPLPISEIEKVRLRMKEIKFDTLHAWHPTQSIEMGAQRILEISLSRYI